MKQSYEEHSMKVKVNFKKPTVMLTADKYSSMLKEMEDMRGVVARKDAEVVERNALIQELSDQVEADEREIADLKASREILREFREELGQEVDEANRVIAEMATELTELKADRNIALTEIERLKGELAQKNKINDTSFKATNELAELLVAAQRERDEAREEAGNYHVELMERDCRVDELEKRNEWLFHEMEQWKQSAENYQCAAIAFQEDLEKLRTAYDTLYERSADNYANAQYWEERAHKLDEEVDTLRRQLKANEESYTALHGMYEELRDAATGLVSHIRANTFAN